MGGASTRPPSACCAHTLPTPPAPPPPTHLTCACAPFAHPPQEAATRRQREYEESMMIDIDSMSDDLSYGVGARGVRSATGRHTLTHPATHAHTYTHAPLHPPSHTPTRPTLPLTLEHTAPLPPYPPTPPSRRSRTPRTRRGGSGTPPCAAWTAASSLTPRVRVAWCVGARNASSVGWVCARARVPCPCHPAPLLTRPPPPLPLAQRWSLWASSRSRMCWRS